MVEPDDTLALKSNTSITSKIGDEKIYFSYKVQKYFKGLFERNKDRIIMITNLAFYLLDETEIKRRIKLEDLYGITVSKLSNQFIIHGRSNEYDYLFISPDKKKIIKALQSSYKAKEGKDLLFCQKSEKDINKYVIQKKEATKNPFIKRINEAELSSIQEYIKSQDAPLSRGDDFVNASEGQKNPKPEVYKNKDKIYEQVNEFPKPVVNKNKISELEGKIKKLEKKLMEKDELIASLNKRIKELENISNNKINSSNKINSNNIIELENEIKLFRTYYKFTDNEKLISIKFISAEQDIDLTVIAKNTDDFSFVEKILYDNYPAYKKFENYFIVNGNKINKNITLEENKIKNNDILTLVINNFD